MGEINKWPHPILRWNNKAFRFPYEINKSGQAKTPPPRYLMVVLLNLLTSGQGLTPVWAHRLSWTGRNPQNEPLSVSVPVLSKQTTFSAPHTLIELGEVQATPCWRRRLWANIMPMVIEGGKAGGMRIVRMSSVRFISVPTATLRKYCKCTNQQRHTATYKSVDMYLQLIKYSRNLC